MSDKKNCIEAQVVSWDPIRIEGLPTTSSGSLKGSISVRFPPYTISIDTDKVDKDIAFMLEVAKQDTVVDIEVESFSLNFDLDDGVEPDAFVENIRESEAQLHELYIETGQEYTEELREWCYDSASGRALVSGWITNRIMG
jgi:hypothetical protein